MTSLDFPRQSGYIWQVRWTNLSYFHNRFSYDLTCEKSLKSVNFWVIQKIKGGRFGDKVYIPESTLDILFGLNYPHQLRPLRSELVNCRKVYCWVWVSVNIWQSYKQERGCLKHFACLSNALQKAKKVHETIAFLLVTLPNIHRFLTFFFTHRLTNKFYLIWLLTTPPNLKYAATLPCIFVAKGLFCWH